MRLDFKTLKIMFDDWIIQNVCITLLKKLCLQYFGASAFVAVAVELNHGNLQTVSFKMPKIILWQSG